MDVSKVTPVSAIYKALNNKRQSTPTLTTKPKPGQGFAQVLEEARKKLV